MLPLPASLTEPRTADKGRTIRNFVIGITIIFVFVTFVQFRFMRGQQQPTRHDAKLRQPAAVDESSLAMAINATSDNVQESSKAVQLLDATYQRDVHVFYYIWWQTPADDGKWLHWNHDVLPHWTPSVNQQYPQVGKRHDADRDDVASDFWPQRGPYSSNRRDTVRAHFESMAAHGIGTAVVSWWGRKEISGGGTDEGGTASDKQFDDMVPMLLQEAARAGLKLCFHLEPYKGRTAVSTAKDVKYLVDTYGSSPALLKVRLDSYGITSGAGRATVDRELPLFYIYDSYLTPSHEWKQVLTTGGSQSIRNTPYDAVMLGLYLKGQDGRTLVDAGFDGFYTYFAASGFTEGSTSTNWPRIAEFAQQNRMLFVPSVGPGYVDVNIRPWNNVNTHDRRNGAYYDDMFGKAIEVKAPIISITSYNEWHEGTQIEEASPKTTSDGRKYLDYSPGAPDLYMTKTRDWSLKFFETRRTSAASRPPPQQQ